MQEQKRPVIRKTRENALKKQIKTPTEHQMAIGGRKETSGSHYSPPWASGNAPKREQARLNESFTESYMRHEAKKTFSNGTKTAGAPR